MKSLFITQEFAPLFAEGGLGLASKALTHALSSGEGIAHDLVLPYYPWLVDRHGLTTEVVHRIPEVEVAGIRAGATIHRLTGSWSATPVHLVRSDPWYARGGIYRDADYVPFADEAVRAAFFGHCVAEWVTRTGRHYDVVHGNDWQSGAALAGLKARTPWLPTLLTVHNAMYQGSLPQNMLHRLMLPQSALALLAAQDTSDPSMLLLGALHADAVATCSPAYAREMGEAFRETGFGRMISRRRVHGILFGVDPDVWDPAAEGRPTVPYTSEDVDLGKRRNKLALQKHMGLALDADVPVFGVCARLVHAKGADLLLEAVAPLLGAGRAQLALVGPVAAEFRGLVDGLIASVGGAIAHLPAFDQDAAWLTYAGADFTVMPSRTEPGGLNQFIAARYGTIPLVSPVGGLLDAVSDIRADPSGGTGMHIPRHTVDSVRETLVEAMAFRTLDAQGFLALRRRNMALDMSWARTARAYAELYRDVAGQQA